MGMVRDIEVHQLWVQAKLANGEVEVRKVDGKSNNAAELTKHVTAWGYARAHTHHIPPSYAQGRHSLMPQTAVDG